MEGDREREEVIRNEAKKGDMEGMKEGREETNCWKGRREKGNIETKHWKRKERNEGLERLKRRKGGT